MADIRAYIPQIDIVNDEIIAIGSNQFSPSVTAADLVQQSPEVYSFQNNSDGETKFCVVKSDQAPLWVTFIHNNSNVTVKALDFNSVSYVGGHPIHRPGQQ